MKLSQWAKEQGLTYKGAWRMWKAGQLPVPAEQLPTGTNHRKGSRDSFPGRRTVCPSFFFGSKKGCGSPIGPLVGVRAEPALAGCGGGSRDWLRPEWAAPKTEKTPRQSHGANHRGGASRPLDALRCRICRAALAAQGRKLMVVESSEVRDDLVQDMLEV